MSIFKRLEDTTVVNNDTVISLESFSNEIEARNTYNELHKEAIDTLEVFHRVSTESRRMELSIVTDLELLKNGELSRTKLELSTEETYMYAELLGLPIDKCSVALSTESDDMSLSLEALNGTRKDLLDRALKRVDKFISGFLDVINKLKAVGGLLLNYNTDKLLAIKNTLDDGSYIVRDNFIGNTGSINKKLAIFYAMGNKFKVSELDTFFSLPYTLIVKEDVYNSGLDYAYDNLVQSRSEEEILPAHKASLTILDSLNIYEVKEWLNKDTKFGLVDRFIGNKFSIVSVYQDTEGADARHDYFTIPLKDYSNKVIPSLSKKELYDLIKVGVKVGDYSGPIWKESKKMLKSTIFKDIRSSIATDIFGSLFSVFAVKRMLRQVYMANEFSGGIYNTMLMMHKSHLDTGDVILSILNGNISKK